MAADEGEEFTYASLVNRWRRERATAALTKMNARFYEAFDQHLRDLRSEYQKEHGLNPATPKVLILQDELMNLQRVRDDIYDLREKKIVTAAVIGARGGNPDRANMTQEEEDLFDEVLRVLRDARRNLLRRGQPKEAVPNLPAPVPGGPPAAPDAAATPEHAAQPAATLADRAPPAEVSPEAPLPGAPEPVPRAPEPAPEQVAAEDEKPARRLGPARVVVRVKEAVAPFVGTDLRQYRLAAEDVAAVPKEVAHALIQRGVAVAVGG